MCERHFDKTQILTHWEHIIKGEVHQIEREKPKIKADAIPYLNLPVSYDASQSVSQKRTHKEPKKRKQNLSNSNQNEKVNDMLFIRSVKESYKKIFVCLLNRLSKKTKNKRKMSAVQ